MVPSPQYPRRRERPGQAKGHVRTYIPTLRDAAPRHDTRRQTQYLVFLSEARLACKKRLQGQGAECGAIIFVLLQTKG